MRASLFFGITLGLVVAGCTPRPAPVEQAAFNVPPPPVPQQIVVPPPQPMPEEVIRQPRERAAYRHKRHHRAHRRHPVYVDAPSRHKVRVRVHGLHGPVYRDRTTAH